MTRHTTIEMSEESPVTVPMAIPATVAMGNAGRLSAERREKTFNSSAALLNTTANHLSLGSFRAGGTNVIPRNYSMQPEWQWQQAASRVTWTEHTPGVFLVSPSFRREFMLNQKFLHVREHKWQWGQPCLILYLKGEKSPGYSHLAVPSEVNRKQIGTQHIANPPGVLNAGCSPGSMQHTAELLPRITLSSVYTWLWCLKTQPCTFL